MPIILLSYLNVSLVEAIQSRCLGLCHEVFWQVCLQPCLEARHEKSWGEMSRFNLDEDYCYLYILICNWFTTQLCKGPGYMWNKMEIWLLKRKRMQLEMLSNRSKRIPSASHLDCANEKLAPIGIRSCISHAQNSRPYMLHCN